MKVIFKNIFFIISIIITMNSCTAINVTTSSVKEKGIKEAISDGMIDAGINKEFINHDVNMFINIFNHIIYKYKFLLLNLNSTSKIIIR